MSKKDKLQCGNLSRSKYKSRSGVFLFLFVALLSAVYFYHWFGIQRDESLSVVEPIVSFEDKDVDDTEYQELFSEDFKEPDLIRTYIQDGTSLAPSAEELPDINHVFHISSIFKLEKFSKPEQNIKKDVVSVLEREKSIRIAVVIDDMGASPSRTNEIIAIKAPLTSSFVTFASQLKKQMAQAKDAGHELMIHVPMQPQSDIFVSDDVLTVDMSQAQIRNGFEEMLKKFSGVVGINNHMGSKFTEYGDKLEPIMDLLAKHKLFFLDSKTTSHSQGEVIAQKYHVPCVHRHVFLDNENDLEYILRQLEKTEAIARKNGYAIAIAHPKTQTAKALSAWIKTLPQKNFRLVHLGEIVSQEAIQY